MSEEAKLCLYGDLARPFVKQKIGTRQVLTIEAVLTQAGIDTHYDGDEDTKEPCVEFTIASVEGRKKSYENMSVDEMEREIGDVMDGRAESVYTDQKKKGELGETPFKRGRREVLR